MLDIKTTNTIQSGKRKNFTFVLNNSRALNGFVTRQFIAKDKQEAIIKLLQEYGTEFNENNGDKVF
tara:strand:- start:6496 stop:6693 length:198 start_codon:yes stop_codon:yes gene_type:complete